MKFIIIFNLLLLTNQLLLSNSDTISITGKIVSANTSQPVAGVTVKVVNEAKGTISKSDGTFILKNLKPGIYSIQFSIIGYETFVQSNVYVTNIKPVNLDILLTEKVIPIEGVEVRGKYFERFVETTTSTQSFSAEEIRRAPGVQEDVLRATALLPGVSVTSPGRNDLIVRGGAPFENLFIIDNIELPNINHFGSQGATGGPLSIVNIDFVRNVQFSAGGFGAKYGDKVSSLTNITLIRGNPQKFGGKATISATGFGINLEGPIDPNNSFFFSIRRSYLDLIFKAAGFSFIPQYWDFQGKVNYALDNRNSFSFFAISALDKTILNNKTNDDRFKNSRVAVPEQDQYFAGISWKHTLENGFLTTTLGRSFTKFFTFQNDSNLINILRNDSKEGENSFRIELDMKLSKIFDVTFGNQVKFASKLKYNLYVDGNFRRDQFGTPQSWQIDTSFTGFKNGTYASVTTSISKHRVTFGIRGDYYSFTQSKFFISPRLSISYMINPVSTIIFSLGRYYQSPSYIWLVGAPQQKLNPIQSDLVVIGYEHTPFEDLKVQLEAYYKTYKNYPAREFRPQSVLAPAGFEDISSDIPFGIEPLLSVGKGWSRGVELFIQKKFNPKLPLYGILSITTSQSRFTSLDGIERKSKYDSPLIFNLSLGYRINPEWEIAYKYRASIGNPTTPYNPDGTLNYSRYNDGERLPIFRATDIRVDKRWFLRNLNIVTYVDIQNIFGTKNKSDVRWNPRERKTEYIQSFGILPSIGFYLEF